MGFEIRHNLELQVYGFQGIAANNDYTGTAFKLMDRMWTAVRENGLKNEGLNIHVYEANDAVFAGVELLSDPAGSGLELKTVSLAKYAWFKHVGPYQLIRRTGTEMRDALKAKGLTTTLPCIEIYGHWNSDETKLETELLMNLS